MVKTGSVNMEEKCAKIVKNSVRKYIKEKCDDQTLASKNFKKYLEVIEMYSDKKVDKYILMDSLGGNNPNSKYGYLLEKTYRELLESSSVYTILDSEIIKKGRCIPLVIKREAERIAQASFGESSICLRTPEELDKVMKNYFNFIHRHKGKARLYYWSSQIDLVYTHNKTGKLTLMEVKASDCFNSKRLETMFLNILYCYAYYVISLDIQSHKDIEFVISIASQGNKKFKNVLSYDLGGGLATFDTFCSEYLRTKNSAFLWNELIKGKKSIKSKNVEILRRIAKLVENQVSVTDKEEYYEKLGIESKAKKRKLLAAKLNKTYTRVKGYKCLENCEITAK